MIQFMNRLYPLVLEHRLPTFVRYGISASIMLACAVLQMALQMQTGSPGYFLLLRNARILLALHSHDFA